ncbi:MAG: tRNA epoxyqueuosine(34) reductase QueG [Hyphomicrobiales bacterium]
MTDKILSALKQDASTYGFDAISIAHAHLPEITRQNLTEYVAKGRHGSMSWMEETLARRADPKTLWPDAKSVIMLGMNYGPDDNPLPQLERTQEGTISVYAQNRDYHDLIKGRLKTIAGRFASRNNAQVKVFVDTAPVMEKPLAEQAGLGWQGKHTNLVSREFGSWLFLGSIFTDLELRPDTPEIDHCGSCRACLDICPTNAFPAPYQLDARRCISYLTIEHKGPIPEEFRKPMGNRIYGCDDCLAACPWNKFASKANEAKLHARDDLKHPDLNFLASLDDAAFRKFFSGSPIKRIGRNRFLRNVLIAIGNSGEEKLKVAAKPHLADPDPVVRDAAEWAIGA